MPPGQTSRSLEPRRTAGRATRYLATLYIGVLRKHLRTAILRGVLIIFFHSVCLPDALVKAYNSTEREPGRAARAGRVSRGGGRGLPVSGAGVEGGRVGWVGWGGDRFSLRERVRVSYRIKRRRKGLQKSRDRGRPVDN